MKSVVLAIDSRIQAVVDRCAFFLMRSLGVGKAYIRYALCAILVSAAIVMVVLPPQFGVTIWNKTGCAIMAALMFMYMHLSYRDDAKADEDGRVASVNDRPFFGGFGKPIFGFLLIFHMFDIAADFAVVSRNQLLARDILGTTVGIVLLLLCYLVKTPRRPPPSKERLAAPAQQPTEG